MYSLHELVKIKFNSWICVMFTYRSHTCEETNNCIENEGKLIRFSVRKFWRTPVVIKTAPQTVEHLNGWKVVSETEYDFVGSKDHQTKLEDQVTTRSCIFKGRLLDWSPFSELEKTQSGSYSGQRRRTPTIFPPNRVQKFRECRGYPFGKRWRSVLMDT